MPVYLAQPEGKSNLPVLLVVSEIFDVHEHIADVAHRFAKQGYLALAPDMFVRHGEPDMAASVAELIRDIISRTPDAEVMADLDACVAWARDHGGDAGRLAITGFCWGGRITWLYAARNPNVKAGVAWYGRLVGAANPINPQHPVDIAAALTVSVLGLYGGKDSGIPLASVEQMKAALAQGRSKSAFVVYPESGHAFNADYRPSYLAADAKDGFARARMVHGQRRCISGGGGAQGRPRGFLQCGAGRFRGQQQSGADHHAGVRNRPFRHVDGT